MAKPADERDDGHMVGAKESFGQKGARVIT